MAQQRGSGDGGGKTLRAVAEARMAAVGAATTERPEDLARLVHELRVHQIELELQNEELEHARGALEDSLSRYTDLYDFAPIGYLSLGRDGEVRELNLEAARVLGFERALLVGRRLAPLLSAASRPVLAAFLARLATGPARCLVEPEHAPGRRLRLRGEHAEEGLSLRILAEDVSELRRAEVERDRLALAVEQIDESVVITDTDGRIVFVNTAFERTSGYARAAVLGQNPRVLKSDTHPPDFYANLWRTLLAGEVWHGRFVNRRKDGSHYTAEATISPLRDEHGVVSHFVAVRRDVTDELALEERMEHARRMEAIGQLAGGVAHDFNNLLLVIKGSAQFALETLADDAPARAELAQIEQASDRAAALTRQLLAFGRKQLLRSEVVDLDALAAGLAPMFHRVLGETLELHLRPTDSLWHVRADPGQIEQVLTNLAVNARDAMPDGGTLAFETSNVDAAAALGIEALASAPPGDYVRLGVSDDGCGMSPEVLARMFEPYFSTKAKHKGTGLGLATVYGIVQQSGGVIACTSEVGKGTAFSIYLPRHLEEHLPTPSERPAGSSSLTAPAAAKGTVLVVEDEDAVRAVVQRILRGAGYDVLTARHGAEALTRWKEGGATIDLVLSDVIMPVMGGLELRRRLAVVEPTLEVVFMSGYPDELRGPLGSELGEVSLLAKPFSAASLLAKVHEHLEARSRPS
jgi:PAS domain S-box-containing protein